MLLTYDIGNTNIVVGLFREEQLLGHWRLSTDRNRTADELRWTTRTLLSEAEAQFTEIQGVAVASVVPSLNAPLAQGLEPFVDGAIRFLDADTSPIRLDVEQPRSVGADRIANSVAGHALYGGPILVLDFGTAITFDLVSQDGAFLGGAIAPEMALAARALTEKAAQLHAFELSVPESVIGKTTAGNIQAGVVLGYLDLVSGLIGRFRAEVGENLTVVATGGKGALFHQHLDAIDRYDAFLTLKGLHLCWERWSVDARAHTKATERFE